MQTVCDNIRHAWRSWIASLRTGGSTIIVILTLAFAMGATTAMFAVVKGLLNVLPYRDAEQLVILWQAMKHGGPRQLHLSIPDYQDFLQQSRSFTHLGIFAPENYNVVVGDHVERIMGAQVGNGFFSILGVKMVMGRDSTTDDSSVVLLSERFWRSRLSNGSDPIGRSVRIDGVDRRVIGVIPRGKEFPVSADIWVPFVPTPEACACNRNGHSFEVIGRLKENVSLAQAEAEIQGIAAHLQSEYPDTNADTTAWLEPLRDSLIADAKPAMWMLVGTTISLLLMACVSVGGILLARGVYRGAEIAIRQAVGATRARIMIQLLLESSFSAIGASILGILVASWMLHVFLLIVPESLAQSQMRHIDARVMAFAAVFSVLTFVIFSLLPALRATRPDFMITIRGGSLSQVAGNSQRVHAGLIVVENALAFALLFTSILLLSSLHKLMRVDPGFGVKRILGGELSLSSKRYSTPQQAISFYNTLLERLRVVPGIEAAAVVDALPMTGSTEGKAYHPVGFYTKAGEERIARVSLVSPGYFETMSIPLLRGRDFSAADGQQSHMIVINEQMARVNWPNTNSIGERVQIKGGGSISWEVIGVVPDIKDDGLTAPSLPRMYLSEQEFGEKEMTVVVRFSRVPEAMINTLRHEVSSLDPNLPIYNFRTVKDLVDSSLSRNRTVGWVVSTFAAMALMLAVVGVYGIMSLNLVQRTKEFGIRIAVGSTFGHIAWLVLRDSFLLVLIGIAIGLAISVGSSRILSSLLFGVGKVDIASSLTAAFVQLLIVMVGCIPLLRRITGLDPIVALRE